MVRSINPDRVHKVIEGAARIFGDRGYKRTKMEDVARTLGVSTGSLYRYFETKEALFKAVIQFAINEPLNIAKETLPLPTTTEDEILAIVQATASRVTVVPEIHQLGEKDTRELLKEVLHILFDLFYDFRHAVRIIERSALDWPQLAELWFGDVRTGLLQDLVNMVQHGIDQGHFVDVPDVEQTARFIVAHISTFSIHAFYEPVHLMPDYVAGKENAIFLLLHSISVAE